MKTAGELFWQNVLMILEENDKSLKDIAKYLESNEKKMLSLYAKLHRHKTEVTNPQNVETGGILEYLKQFDKYLMFSDLYAEG